MLTPSRFKVRSILKRKRRVLVFDAVEYIRGVAFCQFGPEAHILCVFIAPLDFKYLDSTTALKNADVSLGSLKQDVSIKRGDKPYIATVG